MRLHGVGKFRVRSLAADAGAEAAMERIDALLGGFRSRRRDGKQCKTLNKEPVEKHGKND